MQVFFNPTEEFVNKLVEVINNRFVVEIGCGKGVLLKALLDKGLNVIGFDPYINMGDVLPEVKDHILPLDEKTCYKFLSNIDKEIVFLVARPCHSGFPGDYLNFYGDKYEMIYIGFCKNLELDFERELSLIRFVDFPKHDDCDIVAVLKRGEPNKMSQQWDSVDEKVRELKGEIDKDLLDWFLNIKNNYKNYNKEREESLLNHFKGLELGCSHHGGEWYEYKDCLFLSKDITKKRSVKLDVASYMVGGGHFSCNISVKNEEFVKINNKEIEICSPWDRTEHRPDYANSKSLVWYGLKDSKRVSNIEAGLLWLKESFYEFNKRYKDELGIELIPDIGSGLIYEIETYLGKEL